MNAITKPRNPLSAPKKQPRIMSKRQAVATAKSVDNQAKEQGVKTTTNFEMRGPHGTSAALRQALAQMQDDMNAISRRGKAPRRPRS